MHAFALVIFGGTAFVWIVLGLRVAYGALKLPWIKNFSPISGTDVPRVSLLFAARDEEEKLPGALATLAELDYPGLEIIGVDDRSEDATGRILDEFAASHARFRAIHVKELPAGWLGKPHALQQAYEASSGDWLLFTDADVRFQVDVLRRAIRMASERRLDHLSLFGDVEMVGFWEKVVVTFFGMAFHMATAPSDVIDPKSGAYMGVGAFQLLKRSAYEAAGTHRRLAMEVIDDMKLGKIVKQAGFRSGVGIAQDFVVVRWHAGARNLINGVTKNFFAGSGFSVARVAISILGLLLMNVVPFAGLLFGHGWVRIFAGICVLVVLCFHAGVDIVMRVSPLYCFTVPVGAVLFGYMLLRSTVYTLKQGGIVWRGTFYPLEALKRGAV
ncbi:MAG TPA: glycosyltransferase [Candidatus Acidoferrum sp.]|jgi:glycosyltransferase involved in cell wall biosynthesis|nr:glycosyltransferase [Candidatus Acidoferrum sp.]